MGNLKQIGMAMRLYLADYNDTFPVANEGDPGRAHAGATPALSSRAPPWAGGEVAMIGQRWNVGSQVFALGVQVLHHWMVY